MPVTDPHLLEWYRVDETRSIVRIVVQGSALVLGGAVLGGLAYVTASWPEAARWPLAATGALLTASGPLRTIIGFQRVLARDAYVAARTDVLHVHLPPLDLRLPWEHLESAQWNAHARAVVLHTVDGASVELGRPFWGVGGPELARRINHLRRRVLMGLSG